MRILLMVIVLIISTPLTIVATAEDNNIKAGFVRNGDLWLLINDEEHQITNTGNVFGKPSWSDDGKWILYQSEAKAKYQADSQQQEVWAYHIDTGEKKQIFYNGSSPSWSPNKNIVAFNSNGILNISDLSQFYNIATGVSGYTWFPDGSGFLLSTSGVLQPDGWTSASIFTKKVNENYRDVVLFGGVEHFFTLPKEIGLGEKKIIAVHAGDFTFSPSSKWISFIVSPTASWSMDSNMLCVISKDGKKFEVIDEVIFEVGKPKWAPSSDTLAFIAGGGRLVFGFKDKDLKIREMPVSGMYTPEKYADLDFDWISNTSIITSRMEEKEWSNEFSEHPLPSLYSINIETNKQVEISKPPKGYGDYHPQHVKPLDKVVWFRGTSLIDSDKNIWKSNTDGTNAKVWIKNVESIDFYDE